LKNHFRNKFHGIFRGKSLSAEKMYEKSTPGRTALCPNWLTLLSTAGSSSQKENWSKFENGNTNFLVSNFEKNSGKVHDGPHLHQGCQMACFQTKNPNLGKFWRLLQWKMLVYFMDTGSILRSFGKVCGNLVNFSRFGILNGEKSGDPDLHSADDSDLCVHS
jgi:hypothetical protein